jgi:hypothetical protein
VRAVLLLLAAALCSGAGTFSGRWDLAVGDSGGWLEYTPTPSGAGLRLVPRVGGVKSIPAFEINDGRLTFSNTEWFGKWEPVRYDLTVGSGALTGTATRESGPVMPVNGVRAPDLHRKVAAWGEAIRLSDNIGDWKVLSPTKPGNWTLRDGVLTNARSGPNLRTLEEFQDFRLDLEFNCPQGSNSGIFLRGRYELQIEEEPDNHDPLGRTGSIYKFLSAGPAARRHPGEWRKLSITLIGRAVTVTLDGVTIIGGQEIPGPTGGSFNAREGEPGPIILQGDHGAISFRNVLLIPGVQ